jgi:glyoxylase-like metal-dependent hydrolase (beta-lactamase superfamily II)
MTRITRRAALAASAALPLAAATVAAPKPVLAGGHGDAPKRSDHHRTFSLGDFEVTTLLAGSRVVDENIQGIFGMNVDAETFQEVSDAAFIPADKAQFYFTPTVVKTGSEVVLFDTGLNAAGTLAAMEAAGMTAEDVTQIVITHMHGDHVGGLMTDGAPTFANASVFTGQAEFDHWAGQSSDAFEGNVRPMSDQITFLGDGGSPTSGITAMAAFGHTPGHMIYMIESAGKQLVLTADTANHYVWSLAYPDWEVRFDMDKEAAAAARRKVFGMLAADKLPFIGYHMPFPALGYVDTREDGFRYVPETYQMML